MKTKAKVPGLISLVGVDGCGKTTLAIMLQQEFEAHGLRAVRLWSRFRNYTSKPLLALARLSGHSYYRSIDGIRFGYHDFERLPVYREIFALLQAVDVNLAAFWYINRVRPKYDVGICERGPWDTLVDVTSDTNLNDLPKSCLGRVYGAFLARDAVVILINRPIRKILKDRTELQHDPKIKLRSEIYLESARHFGWTIIDNNGSIEDAMGKLKSAVGY